jgi:hypothetical protein
MMQQMLVFSPDGNFEPRYDDSVLGKLFAPTKIVELKQRIAAKADAARRQTGFERRQLLGSLARFVDRGISDLGPLEVIAHPPASEPDGVWTGVNLCEIRRWLADKRPLFAGEKQADTGSFVEAIDRQVARERVRQTLLKRELRALDSGLSFEWLRIDGWHWVLEVVGWTVFGFLANTLISLFQHCRRGSYSADEFILIFPKLALAPLLSLVAVALWSSGISNAPINYLNLPMFLVFAFSLGFCTEQLYTAMKDIASWFISRFATISEDRVAELAKNVPYAFVNPPPPAAGPPPENLQQLRVRSETVARAGFERGTVTKQSNVT